MKNMINYKSPYESDIVDHVKRIKSIIQFLIGISLIIILTLKGTVELFETIGIVKFLKNEFTDHLLAINTFSYVAKALAISAGIELGYMLFTDGPDEAIEPLMLGVTSAAFFTLAEDAKGSWVLGIYAISILILMYCLKKYKDWKLSK